jgi:xanthine dehydrogenase YagR molybdenum-binding subunit
MAELAYAWGVTATIATGEITGFDTAAAEAVPGVLAVIVPGNAPYLDGRDEPELAVFQSRHVSFRGQFVGVVVATTPEAAREAAEAVRVRYAPAVHDVVLTADHPRLYAPPHINPAFDTDTHVGDVDAALRTAAVRIEATYTTPAQHNNPMEPHATTASWDGEHLTLVDSTQGPPRVRAALAVLFGIDPSRIRVMAQYVGGGFGSKGALRVNAVIAAVAARVVGRPVRFTVTRQQMFATTGHRTPSIQRVALGADGNGRLVAVAHDVVEQSSRLKEFAEQTAVATRHMYAAPNRRTTHRLLRLDAPTPSWMRAPGECPGMYALESAVDELAVELGMDPVELRIRNEPAVDPESGLEFSSRNLVACLRRGAELFGWSGRDSTPGVRLRGRRLVGTGVAASIYPARAMPSRASVGVSADGRYEVALTAVDIGTGARTALLMLAAEELGAPMSAVTLRIADTDLPEAMIAGGSMGTASWSWAVIDGCRLLRARLDIEFDDAIPPGGLRVEVDTADQISNRPHRPGFAFGAQFAEVEVDVDTGEVRVPRLLGVFAAGRIVNPVTARSQLVGAMTMGLSMALHEENALDPVHGDFVAHDLVGYHVAASADVVDVQAHWIDEHDDTLGPAGAKGIGEIGIVGTAAAIANAAHHATGVRVRDLPLRLDRFLAGGLSSSARPPRP